MNLENQPHPGKLIGAALEIAAARMRYPLQLLATAVLLGHVVQRLRMFVASQELGVGQTGILAGCSGTRGQAFAGCTFVMADSRSVKSSAECLELPILTLTSSHDCIFFTPSPTPLNASFDSSKSSCTLSRTRSVSRFVPNSAISFVSREMLPVNVKSFAMSSCASRWNSGSSEY